ncbi:unnamed protein product [Rotaria sp. Silwood2]|nr:unnamed protein product [Rotaria sp. Silwood2]
MNDRQPLLNDSSKLSIGDDDDNSSGSKRQLLINSFSDWHGFFSRKKSDNKYIKLDDDTEHNDKDEAVHIFHLFRFANRIDFVLMFTAIFLMLVQTACILANQIIVGRLTGVFAIRSFGDNCGDLHYNFTSPINNSNTYSQDIDHNIFKNSLLHKLRDNAPLLSSSRLPTSSPSFREEVLSLIRWLFIAGIVEYLSDFIKNFLWSISMKRQIYRMSVSLFRSLVQRKHFTIRKLLNPTSPRNKKKYERALRPTRWSSIRQGAMFGVFTGMLSLITYLVYSVGFIFGSLFMSDRAHHSSDISDILVESDRSINEADVWKDDTQSIYNINGDIEFDNVNFIYPSRKEAPILRNLSLIARAGQTTALVGSSGCGKSTCMSLFLRFYEPSSGQITINGQPITDYNVKHLRENVGVVSQEPILFDMTIYENIRFGRVNATREEIEQAAREANAHNFIMQLPDKYETPVGERGVQLSGGEKQRIALARALVKQPTFLLLDEATSALDNVSEKIVQEALDRACNGRTTIVIAHRLTTIQNAHQIYVLDKGSVVEQGTHEALMAIEGGKYQLMVKRQQMEKIYDDQDDMMSIQKATEEDENSIPGSKLTQRIRSKAFACLLRQEVAYFDRRENSSGAICTRLSSDASAIQEMTGTRLGVILEVLSLSFFGILFGCFISWQLTLIIFGSLFILCLVAYGEVCLRLWRNQQFDRMIYRASTLAVEVIHNMRTIKQLSIEKEVLRQYSELARQLFISGRIGASISAAEAFFDLFDRKPAIDNTSTEGQKIVDFRGEIKFDQVKFIYPTRPTSVVLNKFQLNINPSKHVALVGGSGCGKSTIIQLLERFYDVTSGNILLDGIDIRQLNLQWVRSHFGLVSQEPVLFDLTIAENIAYGLENIPMEDIIDAATRANVHEFIEQLPQGYETKVGLKGSFLSGGEKQRIAIARVLLRRPKVLLLDEATSAMDSHNEQIVQEALEQAQTEDPSRTSLIIAHRLSTIRTCDLICVVDRGHIVESGTHTELTQRRGAYYKMLAQDNLQ